MSNSNTEHSKKLRQETAANRRKRIIEEGGHNFNALIEKQDYDKLLAVVAWYSRGDHDKTNKTEVFKTIVNDAYNKLPMDFKNDQLDLLVEGK